MGLDTTHNAWHGPYSSFNDFRREIIRAYNDTDLFGYEGYEMRHRKEFNNKSPQMPLTNIEDNGMYILANHSDCDGLISWVDCKLVADSIEKIITKLKDQHFHNAIQFRNGCLDAFAKKEDLLFQ